jgi:hypothetical protein
LSSRLLHSGGSVVFWAAHAQCCAQCAVHSVQICCCQATAMGVWSQWSSPGQASVVHKCVAWLHAGGGWTLALWKQGKWWGSRPRSCRGAAIRPCIQVPAGMRATRVGACVDDSVQPFRRSSTAQPRNILGFEECSSNIAVGDGGGMVLRLHARSRWVPMFLVLRLTCPVRDGGRCSFLSFVKPADAATVVRAGSGWVWGSSLSACLSHPELCARTSLVSLQQL